MTKPGKKEETQVIMAADDLENKEPQPKDDGIEIPLDDNGEPLSPETIKKNQEEESRKNEEEKHRKNAEFAQRRIDQDKQKLRQELDDKNRRIAELERNNQSFGFRNNMPVIKDDAYWEKRLSEAPVAALHEFEEHKYQQRLQQQREMSERQQITDSWATTLQESQEMAVDEFPSLKEDGSPEYVMFMEILDKNPAWRQSPIGPMKVVKEMRKQLKASGNSGNDVISKAKSEAALEERNRQNRIANQPLSSGRNINNDSNKVVLTKEQIAIAKEMGVPLESYAKIVNRMKTNEGGVTI